jgi:hypothetical protein
MAMHVIVVQRRAARYTCNRHHNTSSVSEMLNTMNWQTLQERRLRTRLILFHKVINENIAIQSQSMTSSSRKDSYRQIQCNKDSYKCDCTFRFLLINIMICLLWRQFAECGCSILGVLRLWHLDILCVEQILIYGHACCSKSGLDFSWLLIKP